MMTFQNEDPSFVLETDRLVLRKLTVDHAAFMLELLNEPSFLQYVGDRGVRTEEDARGYILKGPMNSYERFGHGLYRVELKDGGEPIGICGLLKRETLPDVDLGFAFLPRFWSKGYAFESASAVMVHGRQTLGQRRIVAITSPDNEASIKVLQKLGFVFERMSADEQGAIKLFANEVAGPMA